MSILWQRDNMYVNVLLFISDAAPNMLKAGQSFSAIYSKMAVLARVNYPKVNLLISSVIKVFLESPSRVNM